jgi:DNA-3-methyladenine glycosylase I
MLTSLKRWIRASCPAQRGTSLCLGYGLDITCYSAAPEPRLPSSERIVAFKRAAGAAATEEKGRCGWVPAGDVEYTRYHDQEWGRPVHDDRHLFEMLTLEGAQAGLSWSTILRKRAAYRKAFAGFVPAKVARFDARRRAALLKDAGIVRNRLKIDSTVSNARAFLAVQKEFGSFSTYLWKWVGGHPVLNGWRSRSQVPAYSELSDRISRDLKKRGFRFVGSTIIYAYLQAVGVVNDHTAGCYLYKASRS